MFLTTVLIFPTTVLIATTTVLITYCDRPNSPWRPSSRRRSPSRRPSRPSGWRRSAGKTGKRYGMMTTKQTFTSSPALLSALFPEWFQTSDSREVQLFQFVRNNEHQPNKSQWFFFSSLLTQTTVSPNTFWQTKRHSPDIRIFTSNRQKQTSEQAQRWKDIKNQDIFIEPFTFYRMHK